MIQPAKPKERDGRVLLPQQSAQQPWHGLVIAVGENCAIVAGNIVWYSRSFPMEPIRMALDDGVWANSDLVVLHKQALRAHWKVTKEQAAALMNPDAEPVDPVLERELKKVREAQA